jgi:hypothetical protein
MRAWQSCHLWKLHMMIGVAENQEWATAKKEFCFLQIVPTENFWVSNKQDKIYYISNLQEPMASQCLSDTQDTYQ